MAFLPTALPPVGCLLEMPGLVALRVADNRRDPVPLVRHEEDLAAEGGALLPQGEDLDRLADGILVRLGSPRRLNLLLGDPFFRLQVLTLDEVPRKEQERRQVILWNVRKFLDYPVENARLAYHTLRRTGRSATFLVGICPEAEASALESAFAARGCHVGFIGSSTMALFNLASAHGLLPTGTDVLILNRTPRYISFLFVEDGAPLFFRCRDLDGASGEAPSDDRLAQELRLTFAYYREKLGGTRLSKILLRQWPSDGLSTVASLLDEEALPVEDLESALAALPSGQPRGAMALPLFGLVEGGR